MPSPVLKPANSITISLLIIADYQVEYSTFEPCSLESVILESA
jgi:hypothetical protein